MSELDTKYSDAVRDASRDTILVADRFPFRYLVDDYGISYYAAFVGCSAETEASFETIAFLSEKVNELDIGNVIVLDESSDSIAKTVIENSEDKDSSIVELNSMQSVTADDIKNGATYLSIMEENLEVLKNALLK